jgi:hypothetical protein
MTITAQTNRYSYAGNGVTTAFAYSSRFLADADLVVVSVNDTTGVETVRTLTSDYTLSGAGDANGGTVTMLTAPASGTTLVVYSDPAVTQLVDHINNDNFDVNATVETPLDKLTLICRRIKELITRGLRQPESDIAAIGTLPTLAARKGNFLYFNATTGDPEAAAGTTETPVSVFMATVLDDADAATARTTLGAIASGAVTTSGLTMNTARILGRTTASTGAIEEITVGSGLSLSAGSLSAVAASQAEQEAGSSTTVAVTPGRQQFHPSAAKAWINFDGTGTPAVSASYNMDGSTPITEHGTGDYTLNIATDFSSAAYSFAPGCGTTNRTFQGNDAQAAGSWRGRSFVTTDLSAADVGSLSCVFYGDQS